MDIPYGHCHCGCGSKTPLATRNAPRAGRVKGKPVRYLTGHHLRKSPVDYIEQDCGYETPCWVWQLWVMPNGYGRASIGNCKTGLAHRVYYERFKGPLVKGQQLDHLCRVRACVNPDHLEPVTCAENLRRGAMTKLSKDQVRAIRSSSTPAKEVAAMTGVSLSTVYHIRSRLQWADLDLEPGAPDGEPPIVQGPP